MEIEVGSIVQMENISFHGTTKGKVIEMDVTNKQGNPKCALVCWGDFIHRSRWFANSTTPIRELKLAE